MCNPFKLQLWSKGPLHGDRVLLLQVFCRKFSWHRVMLWPQDLPANTAVVMSQQDFLLPNALIHAQLSASGLQIPVRTYSGSGHGGFLLDFRYQSYLIEMIDVLARRTVS